MHLRDVTTLLEAKAASIPSLDGHKIVLYGAGSKGQECLLGLRSAGYSVVAFIDQVRGGMIEDIPIFKPTDEAVRRLADAGCVAVVSVFNYTADPLSIDDLLRGIGFQHVVGFAALRQVLDVGETYWLSVSQAMTPSPDVLAALWSRLEDPISRKTLAEAAALRKTLDVGMLRDLSLGDQYVPSGVPTPRSKLRFVDGGAFDGDTLRGLLSVGCEFVASAAFEPDAKNYQRLIASELNKSSLGERLFLPCGLGARSGQVRFRSQGLSSSSIAQDGDAVVQVLSLDEALPDFAPSYVKLDIEGAEADAILGMANTLSRHRPAVAVCVYHKPRDLWEIPGLIDAVMPDAAFYLRAHAWSGFELVFYAVPREKLA